MITNEYFRGYFSCLNTIQQSLEEKLKNAQERQFNEEIIFCNDIIEHVKDLRKSYQDLVVELNEKNNK